MAATPVADINYLLYAKNEAHNTFNTFGLPDGVYEVKTRYQELIGEGSFRDRYPIYCYKIKFRAVTPGKHKRILTLLGQRNTFRGCEFVDFQSGSTSDFSLDSDDE